MIDALPAHLMVKCHNCTTMMTLHNMHAIWLDEEDMTGLCVLCYNN